MSITSTSNPSTVSFDFTKMTNAGLLKATRELGHQGKISQRDEAQLEGIASGVDNFYPNGDGPSVQQILSDPTQKDFGAYLAQAYKTISSQPGSKGADLYASILDDITKYQSHSPEQIGGTVSTIASVVLLQQLKLGC